MSILTFHVPLPPKELSPNYSSRFNRRGVSKAKHDYRAEVGLIAGSARNAAKWSMPGRVRVSLLFGTVPNARRLPDPFYRPADEPNAVDAFKGGFDGLVDAHLFSDDRARVMKLGDVSIDSSVGPWVRITVETIE